ncbi:MAG: hypothetical protein QOK18_4221 [Mycobacterium sp.]|nr:hypothetical protein [Mycobacterium sp.]
MGSVEGRQRQPLTRLGLLERWQFNLVQVIEARRQSPSVYQTRIQSTSIAAGKLPAAGSPPPGPPTASVNMGVIQ